MCQLLVVDGFRFIGSIGVVVEAVRVGEQRAQFVDIGLAQYLVLLPGALLANAKERPEQHAWLKCGRVGHAHKGFEDVAQRSGDTPLDRRVRRVKVCLHKGVPPVVFGDAVLVYVPEARQLDLGYRGSSLNVPGSVGGKVQAGDRAPDAPCRGQGGQRTRLFTVFKGPYWTLLGYARLICLKGHDRGGVNRMSASTANVQCINEILDKISGRFIAGQLIIFVLKMRTSRARKLRQSRGVTFDDDKTGIC